MRATLASDPEAPEAIWLIVPTNIQLPLSTKAATTGVLKEANPALGRRSATALPDQVTRPNQPSETTPDRLKTSTRVEILHDEVDWAAAADGLEIEEGRKTREGRSSREGTNVQVVSRFGRRTNENKGRNWENIPGTISIKVKQHRIR